MAQFLQEILWVIPKQKLFLWIEFLRDASATRIMRREDTLLRPVPEDAAPEGDIFDGNIPVSVRPKTLEGANSSAIDAMIKIIDQHRTFEAQLRFIKEAKKLMKMVFR